MIRNILIAIILATHLLNSQTLHDLIPPINLYQNQTIKVLISDLFYAENYNVSFLPNDNVEVNYDKNSKKVSLTPNPTFSGIGLVSFKLNDQI